MASLFSTYDFEKNLNVIVFVCLPVRPSVRPPPAYFPAINRIVFFPFPYIVHSFVCNAESACPFIISWSICLICVNFNIEYFC